MLTYNQGVASEIMLNKNSEIVWLGPVFDQSTLHSAAAVSPAGNRWQLGLIRALQQLGGKINVIGHLPEPVWPRGRLYVKDADGNMPSDIHGHITGYWNLPAIRNSSLMRGYHELIQQNCSIKDSMGVVITYNGSPVNVAGATYARRRYGAPWVCIVADDEAPPNADGYVFLSWGYHQSFVHTKPKLHLDGGVTEIRFPANESGCRIDAERQVVMYTGSLAPLAGADFLARTFRHVKSRKAELWICGKGSNREVEHLAANDSRIKLMGLVPEMELERLMKRAAVFVNPRPSHLPGNEKNFPSKLFEYLSYGKPIISTWTPGLSPEYRDMLIVPERETEGCLATHIENVLEWEHKQRQLFAKRVAIFVENHLWSVQAAKFAWWLAQENLLHASSR